MRNRLIQGAVRLSKRFRIHPAISDLLAFRDCELPLLERTKVQEHLNRCSHCQKELAFIETGLSKFEKVTASVRNSPGTSEAGLFHLQDAIVDRILECHRGTSFRNELELSSYLRKSIEIELEIYLGSLAAGKILRQETAVSLTPWELIDRIRSLVTGFLGREGGLAIAERLTQLCNSASSQRHLAAMPQGLAP